MSNIISHQANGREYLLIEAPEDVFQFGKTREGKCWYRVGSDKTKHPLPDGKYWVEGWAVNLTEEQAAEIVERNPDSYRNYDLPFGLPTAKESLSSLLSSLGMGEGNTLILVKQ